MTDESPTLPCGHERRPGTTICIRCRAEANEVVRQRVRRNAGLSVLGLFTVMAAVGGATWVIDRHGETLRELVTRVEGERPPEPPRERSIARAEAAPLAGTMIPTSAQAVAADSIVVDSGPTPPPVPPVAPVVPEGRTALQEGFEVIRTGDTVRLHFDTPLARTRRRAKFDALVRRTLPELYGAAIDTMIAPAAAAPANAGDLLTELPESGIRYAIGDGWELRLWPETRPGRDGPLVIAYRATVTR